MYFFSCSNFPFWSRDHLKTAADMLDKVRKRQEEVGETFDFQEQVRIV